MSEEKQKFFGISAAILGVFSKTKKNFFSVEKKNFQVDGSIRQSLQLISPIDLLDFIRRL
jgi:hypothetical protein